VVAYFSLRDENLYAEPETPYALSYVAEVTKDGNVAQIDHLVINWGDDVGFYITVEKDEHPKSVCLLTLRYLQFRISKKIPMHRIYNFVFVETLDLRGNRKHLRITVFWL
jgi:hypothetical protein